MRKIILTPILEDNVREAQSAENLRLAREGKITEAEYERRERDLIREARAEANIAQGLPPGYLSPGEIEWKRILAQRRAKASAKRKRKS
jgi:hypothetical protein